MTNARLEELSKILMNKQDEAKELLTKTPEEAVAWLKGQGYDFTIEEVKEFAEKLNQLIQAKSNGELGEDDLENVAGGGSAGWWFAAGCLATVAVICCPW